MVVLDMNAAAVADENESWSKLPDLI